MENKIATYDGVDFNKLRRISDAIAKMDKKGVVKCLIKYFYDYNADDMLNPLPSASIHFVSLLNIPKCVVLIEFKKKPFNKPELSTAEGQARIIYFEELNLNIPVIYLTAPSKKRKFSVLNHEKIHACQYLLDDAYPLTHDQRSIFLKYNLKIASEYLLENNKREEALDFFINATCYTTWIEMEANHFTDEELNLYDWMHNWYLSALPIEKFEALQSMLRLSEYEWDIVQNRYSSFCALIEKEVPWVKDYIGEKNSLHQCILDEHDEYETEMMFGPIKDGGDH